MCGPDFSGDVPGVFSYRFTRAKESSDISSNHSNFLVNEKSSVHQSFSKEDVSAAYYLNAHESAVLGAIWHL